MNTIVISTINHRIQPLNQGNWTLSNGGPILYAFPMKIFQLAPWRRQAPCWAEDVAQGFGTFTRLSEDRFRLEIHGIGVG